MSLSFNTPVDICNRGLQHIGATRISATLGFNEISKNAKECAFVYDKVRRAELRRNPWAFAIRRTVLRAVDTTTRFIQPTMWSSTQVYFINAIVSDATGALWISTIPDNLGAAPGQSTAWDAYFGPLTAQPYDSGTAYSVGELVYEAPGDGTYKVYVSLQTDNAVDPSVPVAWSSTATYGKDMVISYASKMFISLIDLNTGQVPTAAPSIYDPSTTYATGNAVGGSDGAIYTSLGNGNLGNDPTTANGGAFWTNTGVLNPWQDVTNGGYGSDQYLEVSVALSPLAPNYPLGAGPLSHSSSLNVFRLPSGYLRRVSQDPKSGVNNYLGGPSGKIYDDWIEENNFLITSETGPIVLRFVADMTQVTNMDDMFCEGLGARIGVEVCEALTQSDSKIQIVEKLYEKVMREARTVNAIEQAEWDDPPDDDYLTVRM